MSTIRNLAKIGLLTVILAGVSSVSKADDKWQGIANFDVANIDVHGTTPSFSIGLGAYQKIHPNVMVGFGAEIMESWKFSGNPSFPVFVGLHAEKFEENFSPMVDFTTGYNFNTSTFDYSSFFINPLIGVRFGHYGLGLGYLGSIAKVEGAQWASAINIRLAYYFGYHKTKMSESIKNNTNFGLELAADIPLNSNKFIKPTFGEGINLFLLYSITDNVEVGPMVGFHNLNVKLWDTWVPPGSDANGRWEGSHGGLWIPIAIRGKYSARQIKIAGKLYPWGRLDLGGYASTSSELNSGFYCSPAVGVSLDVRDGKSSVDLGLSYMGLSTESEGGRGVDPTKFTTNTLSISLGYTF